MKAAPYQIPLTVRNRPFSKMNVARVAIDKTTVTTMYTQNCLAIDRCALIFLPSTVSEGTKEIKFELKIVLGTVSNGVQDDQKDVLVPRRMWQANIR